MQKCDVRFDTSGLRTGVVSYEDSSFIRGFIVIVLHKVNVPTYSHLLCVGVRVRRLGCSE